MKLCLSCDHEFESSPWRCPRCLFTPQISNGLPVFAPSLLSGSRSYDASHYPQLAARESGHFWFDARNDIIAHFIETCFPIRRRMLEVGCGTGYVLAHIHRRFPHMKLSGSDIYTEGLAFAQQRVNTVDFLQMDVCNIPYRNEFDIIGAFDVLEHIDQDDRALESIFRALKKGGGCLISVPQHRWLWSVQDAIACHQRRYTRSELTARMKAAGFRIVKTTSFLSLLLPVMIVSRLAKDIRKDSGTVDFSNEIHVPPLVNRFFKTICAFENRLIRRGVPFPVGGSLFIAGLKEQ